MLSNTLFSQTPLYTGTYTGAVDFNVQSGTDTIGASIVSGSGSLTNPLDSTTAGTTLSTGNFVTTTGIELTFTAPTNETVTISHDDGVSLFSDGTNVLSTSASSPRVEVDATASLSAVATYTLYYIEANGLPADLNLTAVPEPASLALLGAGLFGLGFIRRRRGKAS